MLDYTAREDKPKDMGPLLKHYLCVFNPETGELEVVEAKKMVVRGVVRARNTLDAGMAERPVTQVCCSPGSYLLKDTNVY